ncbi:hydrogenase small subunit [Sulfurimonas sp.]|uniref:hydrogenase small subunit n=1 Tax=Sulfurimonas sp. TaxID=2022749 RepID=UPI00356894C2
MVERREALAKMFTAKGSKVNTNRGAEYYDSLFDTMTKRLNELEQTEVATKNSIANVLEAEGLTRRDFMKWASATCAALMLPSNFTPLVAKAAELMNRVPVIWLELQDCAGNSEAILRSDAPTIDELILEVISLEFNETIMVAAGHQAEEHLEEAMKTFKGRYLCVVEGSIPVGPGREWCTIGAKGETFEEHLKHVSHNAAALVAVGTCATFGGVPAAAPNPTGAVGVQDVITGKPVINIPACPANPANITGTILHFVLTGQIPELDHLNRPKFAFGYRIHDNCERRAHFDAGEFVEEWGDIGAQNNFCLYKMGCKGPMTFNNCSIVRYNEGVNWPIGAGHGCIGCSEPQFWDKYAYERPMADANIKAPTGGVEKTVDEFGLGLLTAAGVGIGIHAVASAVGGKKEECKEGAE